MKKGDLPIWREERRTALYAINLQNAKENRPHTSTQVFKCHLHINPGKSRTGALFTDMRTFARIKHMDTTDKQCPIKRTDCSDSTLSFIRYYLSWCQDCGVFWVLERPWQARWCLDIVEAGSNMHSQNQYIIGQNMMVLSRARIGPPPPSVARGHITQSLLVGVNHHSEWKGSSHMLRALQLCPKGLSTSCPIGLTGDYDLCLDTAHELESCSGCALTGEGQDCTTIKGVGNVGCVQGQCTGKWTCTASLSLFWLPSVVYTCAAGYKCSHDGKSYVPS